MKKFNIKHLKFVPAGHENPKAPGVLKKVILTANDVKIEGAIQMINWSRMRVKQSFARHYHEQMDEIFIILSGKAKIEIGKEQDIVEATDTVYIPMGTKHKMTNISTENVEYIAMGIVRSSGGKTVVVEKSETK